MGPSLPKSLREFQSNVVRAPSTATRLRNEAQGWTEGTTLGVGCGGGVNPNGVVSRRPDTQSPVIPSGHNPFGVGVARCIPAHPKPDGQGLPKGLAIRPKRE